jgi:lysozyme
LGESPPHFIIFKTTEGSTHKDTKYASYFKEAKSRGILVGGYHFFSYQSAGSHQAKHFLKNLNLAKGDIIPVLDVEFRKKMNSDKWIRENGGDFIRIVEQEIGVKPIVYCEIAYYNRYIKQKYGSQIKL